MKNSTKRILFVLLSLVFLLSSVAVYSTLIRPAYTEVSLLRGRLKSETVTLERYKTTLQDVQLLLNQLSDSAQVQRQVSLIFPADKDISYFVSQVVELSRINGLSLDSFTTQLAPIQPSNSSIIRGIGRIRGEVRIEGSYAGFKAFLRQLERNMLIVDVSGIRIERSGQNDFLGYSLSLTSYYQAQ